MTSQNEAIQTLREARDQIMKLKEEVDRLAQPPAGFGTFLARNEDDSIDVFTGGRKLRVNVSPFVDLDELQRGQEALNEALNVVAAFDFEKVGEVVKVWASRSRTATGRWSSRTPTRSGSYASPSRCPRHDPGRRLAAARRTRRLRLREGAEVGGRGASSSRRSRTSTRRSAG